MKSKAYASVGMARTRLARDFPSRTSRDVRVGSVSCGAGATGATDKHGQTRTSSPRTLRTSTDKHTVCRVGVLIFSPINARELIKPIGLEVARLYLPNAFLADYPFI